MIVENTVIKIELTPYKGRIVSINPNLDAHIDFCKDIKTKRITIVCRLFGYKNGEEHTVENISDCLTYAVTSPENGNKKAESWYERIGKDQLNQLMWGRFGRDIL